MDGWRRSLERLVARRGAELFPLNVFNIAPPSRNPWPAELPSCQGILDFYALCDGGQLSLQYLWLPLNMVEAETYRWRDLLHDYRGDGNPVLLNGRHIVVATDSAGAPLVWDAADDSLATFFWKGGDWEPLGMSFEAFISALFSQPERVYAGGSGDLWDDALRQLATAD